MLVVSRAEDPDAWATAQRMPTSWTSQYGTCGGKAAYARKTSTGSWQVKVHDPTNLRAGHDGWVLLGEGWPTLGDACAATGLSYRP